MIFWCREQHRRGVQENRVEKKSIRKSQTLNIYIFKIDILIKTIQQISSFLLQIITRHFEPNLHVKLFYMIYNLPHALTLTFFFFFLIIIFSYILVFAKSCLNLLLSTVVCFIPAWLLFSTQDSDSSCHFIHSGLNLFISGAEESQGEHSL